MFLIRKFVEFILKFEKNFKILCLNRKTSKEMKIWSMKFGPLAPQDNDVNESYLRKFRKWCLEYFIGQLFTVYRYIHPIAKYQIRYDRKNFGKAVEHIANGFPLYAYHSTNPIVPQRNFPMKIKKPIVFQPIFMWGMALRCCLVTFIPILTTDPALRSWWGADVWYGRGGMYADITIMLWSNMCALFLKFGLSNRILDYKFMTLYFIARDGPAWLHPSVFDLEDGDYEKYRRYRKVCAQTQVIATFTAFPMSTAYQVFMSWYQGFYYVKPIQTILWSIIFFFWFAYISFRKFINFFIIFSNVFSLVLYGNLFAFSVVGMYLCVKKKRYMTRIITMENGVKFRWSVFYDSATKITLLHDELLDYYRVFMWYMSFFFGNLMIIFCNFIYVIFLGRTVPTSLRFVIGWVTVLHIAVIQLIIYFSDDVLRQNSRIVGFILRLIRRRGFYNLRLWSRLKVHHFYYELSRSKIGFRVINGYILRRKTVLLVSYSVIFSLSYFLTLTINFCTLIIASSKHHNLFNVGLQETRKPRTVQRLNIQLKTNFPLFFSIENLLENLMSLFWFVNILN